MGRILWCWLGLWVACGAGPLWGQPPRPGLAGPPAALPAGVTALRDLAYVDQGHERQKLDLYLPADRADDAPPLPVVLWVHGGAWRGGSKDRCPIADMATRGYAVASVNYRLSQHAQFPAQIHDLKAAVRWLRANAAKYRLDPRRFGAHGTSAGGHLVALLGTTGDVKELEGTLGNLDQSSRVQAVVDWFGPTDFTQMNAQAARRGPIDHDSPTAPEALLIGGPVPQRKREAAAANPITYVSPDDPPLLMVHGDADPLVPLGQSELLHAAYQKAGATSTLYVVKDGGHGAWRDPQPRELTRQFFDRHLLTTGD